jgi:small-conductance mechanosensitive channel
LPRARRGITRKLIALLTWLVAIVFLVALFGTRLRSLAVTVGLVGAGLALGLKEVIYSLSGWGAITMGNFYKTGDRIELGGIKGDVIDISPLRTTLMEIGQWVKGDLYSGRMVRLANSFVFKAPVFNYSADFPFVWDELTVPIKYGCDLELARQILARVANEVVGEYTAWARSAWVEVVKKYMIEDAPVDPLITVTANSNWVEFTVRYIVDYKVRRRTQDTLFTRIVAEVAATGGRVAVASTTFAVVQTPPLDVRIGEPMGQRPKMPGT